MMVKMCRKSPVKLQGGDACAPQTLYLANFLSGSIATHLEI